MLSEAKHPATSIAHAIQVHPKASRAFDIALRHSAVEVAGFFASLNMTIMREPLGRSNSPAQLTHCSHGASTQCAVKKCFRFQP